MRHLTKRLTIVNRGNQFDNAEAMGKVLERYVTKMVLKGWKVYRVSGGDCFLKYENYVEMYK